MCDIHLACYMKQLPFLFVQSPREDRLIFFTDDAVLLRVRPVALLTSAITFLVKDRRHRHDIHVE